MLKISWFEISIKFFNFKFQWYCISFYDEFAVIQYDSLASSFVGEYSFKV